MFFTINAKLAHSHNVGNGVVIAALPLVQGTVSLPGYYQNQLFHQATTSMYRFQQGVSSVFFTKAVLSLTMVPQMLTTLPWYSMVRAGCGNTQRSRLITGRR